jgi:hypothetical protein
MRLKRWALIAALFGVVWGSGFVLAEPQTITVQLGTDEYIVVFKADTIALPGMPTHLDGNAVRVIKADGTPGGRVLHFQPVGQPVPNWPSALTVQHLQGFKVPLIIVKGSHCIVNSNGQQVCG